MKSLDQYGVFRAGRDLYTLNMVPGSQVYGERLVKAGGKEYRRWNPKRSKLSALLHRGLKEYGFSSGSKVLYLGASTGTTVSHISDICAEGQIWALEFSPSCYRKLCDLSERRSNIIPILDDANHPSNYAPFIYSKADIIWQDISQRNQLEILIKNVVRFGSSDSLVYFVLKTRSIDASRSFRDVVRSINSRLDEQFSVIQSVDISDFERDHMVFVLRTK